MYDVEVTTSDISGAGTDANVFILLYGEEGAWMGEACAGKAREGESSKQNWGNGVALFVGMAHGRRAVGTALCMVASITHAHEKNHLSLLAQARLGHCYWM